MYAVVVSLQKTTKQWQLLLDTDGQIINYFLRVPVENNESCSIYYNSTSTYRKNKLIIVPSLSRSNNHYFLGVDKIEN